MFIKKNKNNSYLILLNKKILLNTIQYYFKRNNILTPQKKLLNILHQYTGYSTINIIGKNIMLSKLHLEVKYNIFFKYTQFFLSNLISKIYNLKIFKLKYKEIKKKYIKLVKKKGFVNFQICTIFENFLKNFPFFILKQYKSFLSKMFYFFLLQNYDINNKFEILKNSFKYIYKRCNNHFFRAYKIYKMLLNKLFKFNLLNVYGIKIIFKGRFGKVRKQVSRLDIGSLCLNKLIQKVIYLKSVLLTTRGSYGFHIWFAEKD